MFNKRLTDGGCNGLQYHTAKARLAALILAACLLCAGCTGRVVASVMQLIKTEGTVGVSDEGGNTVSLVENMGLYSGYQMDTAEQSYAWINLDSVKLTKMDAESEIEIRKDGKNLAIAVKSGGFYFHVTEPLAEDETMDIRTSTMTVGIRGTCGWVRVVDEMHMQVCILEGTVQCTVTEPESGQSVSGEVTAGEKAELVVSPEKEEKCEIIKEDLLLYEIPMFVLTELFADDALCDKINEASALDASGDGLPERCLDMGREWMEQANQEDQENKGDQENQANQGNQEDQENQANQEHRELTPAIGYFTMAAELDPALTEAYVLRGNAYAFSGDTEENLGMAQADYETAIGQDETNAQAWLGLADISIRRGEYDEALHVLQEGLEKTGNNSGVADKIAELESGTVTDSQHKTRRLTGYDAAGNTVWYHDYSYDDEGRKARIEAYNGSGQQIGEGDFLYDEQGKVLQSWGWADATGMLLKEILEYDAAGNEIGFDHYDESGNLLSHYTEEYDDNGNQIRETEYGPDGALMGYTSREYDGNGHNVRNESYGPDGTLNSYWVNEYGTSGKPAKRTFYNADGIVDQVQIFEYDENGNQVSVQMIGGGEE